MESADSIRSLYRYFLSGITTKSINAFYYACSYAKVDCSVFMNVTAGPSMLLVLADLRSQPLFLCIDDTMVSKFGKKFEDVSKLFDHAAHHVPITSTDTALSALCCVLPVWDRDRSLTLPSRLDTVCGRRKNQNWNWSQPWYAR